MVRAQRELIHHLGIEKLLCVAGGSMGGMQTLEWVTQFPDAVQSAMVIASTHLSGAQQIAFDAVGRNAIRADEAFKNGVYGEDDGPDRGLAIARMLAHITYLSDASMQTKFGRNLRGADKLKYDFDSEFAVETYLDYQGEQFVNRFDANTYLYVTKAMDYFDISAKFGSLDAAMATVQSKMLVLSFSSDWLYPPYQSEQIVYALARKKRDVTYVNIRSEYGHDAFLLEIDVLSRVVGGFLDNQTQHAHPPAVHHPPHAVKPARADSIYTGHRIDYDTIVNLVEPGSRVLDIGCGTGELLERLVQRRNVRGLGLEVDQESLVTCIEKGLSVIQADIDKGLTELPDDSFDAVLLSMTLQVVRNPKLVLREMLRVGKKGIVSFPNFAHWRVRAQTAILGRAPLTRNLPFKWYESPNRHSLTIKDFREFCDQLNIKIEREIPLSSRGETHIWPNALAEEALYVLSGDVR